jgi:hypothetical protein
VDGSSGRLCNAPTFLPVLQSRPLPVIVSQVAIVELRALRRVHFDTVTSVTEEMQCIVFGLSVSN